MSEENEKRDYYQYNTYNDPKNDGTFIKLKLDTSPLLERIETFLSAKRIVIIQDANGQYQEQTQIVGEQYCNEIGVAAILCMVDLRANNHSVQGNLDKNDYWDFMADTIEELSKTIVLNSYIWEIRDDKLDEIIDNLVAFITLFCTRTIDNKERESLMSGFQSREVISDGKKGLLSGFAGGLGGKN